LAPFENHIIGKDSDEKENIHFMHELSKMPINIQEPRDSDVNM